MARKIMRELFVCRLRYQDLLLYLASTEKGAVRVCLRMGHPYDATAFFTHLFPRTRISKGKGQNSSLIEAVESALEGKPLSRSIPLDIDLTPFQHTAYKTISRIPYGCTWTYGQVARAMGRPGAARAVGQAMGANPLPIIFP